MYCDLKSRLVMDKLSQQKIQGQVRMYKHTAQAQLN